MINIQNLAETLKSAESSLKTQGYVQKLRSPFRILISTILSARTKDEVTEKVSNSLFSEISTVQDLNNLNELKLQKIIRPIGFYKTKARMLKATAKQLIEEYNGKVPETIDELVRLPGVGRKTANLVVSVAFGKPGVCVDTHVHRICNRWGLFETKTPIKTEMAIRHRIPENLWSKLNSVLVPFGKETCKPISPLCTKCPLSNQCPKLEVKVHR
ncbi:MAG: endonuclease III [Candidatus Altiarchaeota archaeon]|nr:endonuclease III [Candidatus Altiarchaeota archaeon]